MDNKAEERQEANDIYIFSQKLMFALEDCKQKVTNGRTVFNTLYADDL